MFGSHYLVPENAGKSPKKLKIVVLIEKVTMLRKQVPRGTSDATTSSLINHHHCCCCSFKVSPPSKSAHLELMQYDRPTDGHDLFKRCVVASKTLSFSCNGNFLISFGSAFLNAAALTVLKFLRTSKSP